MTGKSIQPVDSCGREPHTHQVREFDPERIVLSAQAKGLGKKDKRTVEPERLVRLASAGGRTAPTGPRSCGRLSPGLRPGLTEAAFQAEDNKADGIGVLAHERWRHP